MKKQQEVLFSVVRTHAIISRNLQPNGLDFTDYMILYYLNTAEGKRLRRIDIAERLGFTASGATRMLLPLEKRKIIETEQGTKDARTRYAKLTGPGKILFDEATQSLEMILENMFSKKSNTKSEEVIQILETIMNTLIEKEYATEAKERWGDGEAYKQSAKRMKKMSQADIAQIKNDGEELMQAIACKMDRDVASEEVQNLIREHYQSLHQFYTPTPEIYEGLADMYVDDERFNAYFEKFRPGLAVFMRDAMKVYIARK